MLFNYVGTLRPQLFIGTTINIAGWKILKRKASKKDNYKPFLPCHSAQIIYLPEMIIQMAYQMNQEECCTYIFL